MSVSLQVLYPTTGGATFDHAYYTATHIPIVAEHMAPHAERIIYVRVADGEDGQPGPAHAVATFIFRDAAAREAALAAAGPALDDIPNFYSGTPQMMMGDVIA
ncbi:conserved hypothetical protein [Loktanella atrilutea]|uniref:EthD domain-containing protein n=1 Tax=Loktanella atrilutea TaxID=366533 RepID=A0A1M5DZZ1_LOKAT|nr:EthD family reductase [Loktanella atrilutea]SHF72486.1 conserved hypothetical protein [Loktanella atrilutea]